MTDKSSLLMFQSGSKRNLNKNLGLADLVVSRIKLKFSLFTTSEELLVKLH